MDSTNVVIANYGKAKSLSNTDSVKKENVPTKKPFTRLASKDIPNSNSFAQRYTRTLERSNSLRQPNRDSPKKPITPRRSDSLRKSDSQSSVASKRSGTSGTSRNSLLDSRSSLNSTTSTSTVKRLPLKPSNTNSGAAAKSAQRTTSMKTFNPSLNKTVTPKRANTTANPSVSLKPPRPQGLSFMKPTAASATKMNTTSPSSRLNSPLYRSKR